MTEQTGPQLNLNDFVTVVNVIDVCTERGAFRGNELLAVGTTRERFAAFVKANTPEEGAAASSEVEPYVEVQSQALHVDAVRHVNLQGSHRALPAGADTHTDLGLELGRAVGYRAGVNEHSAFPIASAALDADGALPLEARQTHGAPAGHQAVGQTHTQVVVAVATHTVVAAQVKELRAGQAGAGLGHDGAGLRSQREPPVRGAATGGRRTP